MTPDFSQSIIPIDPGRKLKVFSELTLGRTQCHFYCTLLTRPDPKWRTTREPDDQEAWLPGEMLFNLAATEDRISTFKMGGGPDPWQKGPQEQAQEYVGNNKWF